MRRVVFFLFFLVATAASAATPHLDLNLRLDPTTRVLDATATLTGAPDLQVLTLDRGLHITRLEVEGRRVRIPAAQTDGALNRYPIGAYGHGVHRLRVTYSGRLSPLVPLDQRQVLGRLPPMADPDGSYLPAGSGWYPDPGRLFSFRVHLSLPPGQKGLVPGRLVREKEGRRGYSAEFEFDHPAEGVTLMAGPYQVSERLLTLPDGKKVRLRTWFHPELAPLAKGYLTDSARYIERYSRLIGPYPFSDFSIVSSPLPTGFGMPSLTYLGRQVLQLPFIRATSLGHEILHNWWGNGVYPDYDRGNWSEGLTTFLADYAYKEDKSQEAAKQARLAWLRDLTAVPPAQDTPLRDFVARHHGISSIIGYDKAAMVFFMLRDLIGREAFDRGLRLLWQEKRFKTASWADLQAAFAQASGRDLSGFFRQWVQRAGEPSLRITRADLNGRSLNVTLEQSSGDYNLRVPLRLFIYPDKTEDRWVDLSGPEATVRLPIHGLVQAVALDPDYRIWRRVDPKRFPAILREVFVAPRVNVVVPDADASVRRAAFVLAERTLDAPPVPITARGPGLPGEGAVLILGTEGRVDAWLARQGLPPRPKNLDGKGTAQVWADRTRGERPYAVVSAKDADDLMALVRGLPHYGRESWLAFDGARAADKGIWPPQPELTHVRIEGPVGMSGFQPSSTPAVPPGAGDMGRAHRSSPN